MDANRAGPAASSGPGFEEAQVPPYVLHPHPLESASGQVESLPIYTEQHDPNSPINIAELNDALCFQGGSRANDINMWRRYINSLGLTKQTEKERRLAEMQIITLYFSAIERGQEDVIALLIENRLVTANTTKFQITPLLMAISKKNVRVVQLLLSLGADLNAFGSAPSRNSKRTPLQLAASMGHLVLVKILMEQYHCDDSLIAPDGQIALRLAAENGHQEVVDYLPARRGGGFRRWKHRNQTAVRRAKKAAQGIGAFTKFFVWDIEKFFLWTVPKHLVFKPLVKWSSWCWKHRAGFGPWCVWQLKEMPGRLEKFVKSIGRTISRFGNWIWKVILEIPRLIKDLAAWIWKAALKVPGLIKDLMAWIWKFITVRLRKAVGLLTHWIVSGLTSLGRTVWNAILKIISLLSTIIAAVVSFFRDLTLKDIWNGFCDALRAVFVAFPKLVGSWIMAFGEETYKMMKLILGELGVMLWYIGYGLLWVVTFLPIELWVIVQSLGSVIAKGWYEVKVWMNPKAR